MNTSVFSIELTLGPGPQYPYGEFGCSYQLFVPLHPDGRVDVDTLGQGGGNFPGTRLRAGDGEAHGQIVLGPWKRFVLAYDELRFYPSTLLFGSDPLAVGSFLRIIEYNGEAQDYQITSMRRIADAAVPVKEPA